MIKQLLLILSLLGLPLAAMAHPDDMMSTFMSGFTHPLTGLDHLLVILAVGFLSGRLKGKITHMPLMFGCLMLLGAIIGIPFSGLSFIEMLLALSLILMAQLVILGKTIATPVQFTVVGLTALIHGAVHGQELAMNYSSFSALAGLATATTVIMLSGLYLGQFKERAGVIIRQSLITVLTFSGIYFLVN
jgi:urease accessory protein